MTMNIAKMTKLAPIEIGYVIDPERPVIPLAMEVNRAGCAAAHRHPRGQLLYAGSGVMRIYGDGKAWVAPPSQAVWMPPEVEHEVYFPGHVSLHNLFLDPSAIRDMPDRCCVINVKPLLRELILRAVAIGDAYRRHSQEWRLLEVLLDELRQAEPAPFCLPLARDERLRRVMDILLEKPDDHRGLEHWSRVACTSSRTLSRMFAAETGLTFGDWRRQLRILAAIERLEKGQSITETAMELGYRSTSAFIAMFRKTLGVPPGQYRG